MPMNRDSAGAGSTDAAAPIELAREGPFALAHVTVTPAALRVEAGAWSQRLEPRAMQALVLLAQASPAVVGRAELNARVWAGRVVGDDAINRAVQTLRRLAQDAPAPAPFSIETIPRVGYRLVGGHGDEAAPGASAGDAAPRHAPAMASAARTTDHQPPASAGLGRRAAFGAAAIAVLAAILLWRGFGARHPAPALWRVAAAAALDDLPPGASDVAISPDGRRLAYRATDGAGRERIFVRAADDGGVGSPVSPQAFDAHRPAWSPDGADLAFSTYDPGRPCRLFVLRGGHAATPVGSCETAREPSLAWSADRRSLLFGDAPGWNAVPRISAVRLADGERTVLSSPPGDSMGDDDPMTLGQEIVFRRQFAWADEGWIARDVATGRERLLWRRRGVAGSVAAPLPGGAVAVAWTRAGASGLDVIAADGRETSQPVALGPVTAIAAARSRLLVETDRSESALARADAAATSAAPLATVRGRIAGPILLPDGRLRFPVIAAGVARVWERDRAGALRPWGAFTAARIAGLAPSPDGRLTAALATGNAGREIVVFDAGGKPVYRWSPRARSLNPAAWSGDGRHLTAPVLDGAGWRLFELDPFGGAPPRDLEVPGFAVLLSHGSAMYAVRAGEMMGMRELWRLDGHVRRLPIDLTLFDIINWRAVDDGVWLPDRSDRDHPRLALRDFATGRILRTLAAPGLAGAGTGLAADDRGPVYVKTVRDAPEYSMLTLSSATDQAARRTPAP